MRRFSSKGNTSSVKRVNHCRGFGLYGTPAPAPLPDPSLKLGATGTVKAPPSPYFKPTSLLASQGLIDENGVIIQKAEVDAKSSAYSPYSQFMQKGRDATAPRSSASSPYHTSLGGLPTAPLPKALQGTIVVWSAVDRKGIIEVLGGQDGGPSRTKWYRILSPRAFETLVPPHVRDLTGAKVTHFMPIEANRDGAYEPVRIYNKLVRPQFYQPSPLVSHKDLLAKAERQMRRKAHGIDVANSIDRLSAIAIDKGVVSVDDDADGAARRLKTLQQSGEEAKAFARSVANSEAVDEDEDAEDGIDDEDGGGEGTLEFDEKGQPRGVDKLDIATQIIVDLSTAVSAKGKDLVGLKARDYFEGGVRPALQSGVKDLRNKALFSKEELAMIAARQEVSRERREKKEREAFENQQKEKEGGVGGGSSLSSPSVVVPLPSAPLKANAAPLPYLTPAEEAEDEAKVRALATQKLAQLRLDEEAVQSFKESEHDMSDLGIKKIDRSRIKFSLGSGVEATPFPQDSATGTITTSGNGSSDAAQQQQFDEVLKSMRARITASTSASAASAAAALANDSNTIIRTIHATKVVGKVIAWSQLHRTGLIVRYDESKSEEENKLLEAKLDSDLTDGFVIRNVDAFTSAMPTAAALNGRKVQFTVVSYSDVKKGLTRFAEDIVILGVPINYKIDDPEARKAAKDKEREEQKLRRSHKNFITEEVVRPKVAPVGNVFGVVTRWSGGQGAIESSAGVVYYINNPKAFTNVVDTSHSSAIRGAVVRFTVDPASPEYAHTVEMLSSPSMSGGSGGSSLSFGGGAKAVGDIGRTHGAKHGGVDIRTVTAEELGVAAEPSGSSSGTGDEGFASIVGDYKNAQPSEATLAARRKLTPAPSAQQQQEEQEAQLCDGVDPKKHVMHSGDLAPDDPRWLYGFLVTYSELEGQAIIQALTKKFQDLEVKDERGIRRLRPHQLGDRYLLKDFNTNVVNYDGANRVMIKKGRKVKFIPFGNSGRMATLVTPTDIALSEEEVKELEAQDKAKAEETNRELAPSEEALPGPTSGTYWMHRLERVGFDMSEIKNMKGHGKDGALDPKEHAKQRANTMGLDEEDLKGDEFDPIAVMENDPWYKDKSKNIKIPGSDMRLGDVQRLSPSTMMGLATKVKNPESLQKTKDKYYNKLTESQKEWAWNQAKQQAPLYEKRIKEAQMKGEEPKFTFF